MPKLQTAWYGWRPDLPDQRDKRFSRPRITRLPASISLRDRVGPVLNQGELGACTAHAASTAFAFLHPGFSLSRLKLYFDERAIEGTIREDAGAYLRDAVKVLNKIGAAREYLWPYRVERFADKPTSQATADAARHRIAKYMRVAPVDYRACLAAGFPFIIGFSVYEGFESAETERTGRVRMPKKTEQLLGGHAVCVIGYATKWRERHYEVRNSWGDDWGDEGNFWIPARFLENLDLADDGWTIRA